MTNTENDLSRPTLDTDYTTDTIPGTSLMFATCLACGTQTAEYRDANKVRHDIETHVYAHWTQPEPASPETRKSLRSLMKMDTDDFTDLISDAERDAKGWYQYTDQDGDTWTTNDPMWTP